MKIKQFFNRRIFWRRKKTKGPGGKSGLRASPVQSPAPEARRLDSKWLTEELMLEVAAFMNVAEVLRFSQVCRRAYQFRDRLLRDLLKQQHQISMDDDITFAEDRKATLSLVKFVKGATIECQRATWTSSGESFLSRYLDGAEPITRLRVTWDGVVFDNHKRPNRCAEPLPWKCILGWITILKPTSRVQGQIKVVAKGPKDTAVSYINVFLANPQLLHCRMITFCEAQARSLKGSWLFSRPTIRSTGSIDNVAAAQQEGCVTIPPTQ